MINTNEKLLDILSESQYFLLSKIVKYGKKCCPKNEVLCRSTKWGLKKIQKVKKELISLGLLEVTNRWKTVNDKKVRDSNQYRITTNLISKFRGKSKELELSQFDSIELELSRFELVHFELSQFELVQKGIDNKVLRIIIIDNNKLLIKESKEKNTLLEKFQLENENLKAQILELKILNEKQRKKVSLKKESKNMPLGLSSFEQMEYRRKNKTWTQLDTNFNGGFKMPIEWPENLQNEVLGQWIYLDEKKGQNWGTSRTLSAQITLINDWLKKYTAAEIIESLKDCQQRGNVTPNPKWTINRKLKEKQDDEKQRANNGKSIYENYADYLRGDHDPDENDTIDISWASA
jgi:hypothetical protein